jgi:hypothetical protein
MAAPAPDLAGLTQQVQAIIHDWRDGAPADAAAAVRDLDGVGAYPSLVVDLAYEEYCLAETAGAPPSIGAFCDRFGSVRSKLRDVLEGHQILTTHTNLLPAAEWPAVGEAWQDLRVVRELGRGAFARVYLALDPAINRRIVLKLSQRPTREGHSLGSVKHPHVVDVLWSRQLGGFSAVGMPYEGTATLRAVIETLFADGAKPTTADPLLKLAEKDEPPQEPRRPLLTHSLPYTTAIAMVFERLAAALDHAQWHGIGHGDLKPANILLGPGGHPFLIDFNLATDASDPRWVVGGTLPYMAPERLHLMAKEKLPAATDLRADVYSFGVVLFEALTGRLPFANPPARPADVPTAADELTRRGTGFVKTPADLPKGLRTLLNDCLAADPASRPAFAGVAERLAAFHVRPQQRRQYVRAAVVSLAVLGAAAAAFPYLAPAPPAPPADTAAEVTVPRTAEDFIERGRVFLAKEDPLSAAADFDRAAQMRPGDGHTKALAAYAHGQAGLHNQALSRGQAAVDDLGYTEPWAVTNLATALVLSRAPHPPDMTRAEELSTAVLALDPDHRAARHTRALARYYRDTADGNGGFKVLAKRDCLDDIDVLLNLGPKSRKLYVEAAMLYAAEGTERGRRKAVDLARRAIVMGHSARSVVKNAQLAHFLNGVPGFKELEFVKPDPTFVDTSTPLFISPFAP